MRITGFNEIKQPGTTRKKTAAGSAASSFAALLDQAGTPGDTPAPAAAAASASVMDALLSAQEISEDEARRRQEIRQGFNALETLDKLRLSLLAGRLSPPLIAALAETAARQRPLVSDPTLMALLDDIELRAAVELAKIEVATTKK